MFELQESVNMVRKNAQKSSNDLIWLISKFSSKDLESGGEDEITWMKVMRSFWQQLIQLLIGIMGEYRAYKADHE